MAIGRITTKLFSSLRRFVPGKPVGQPVRQIYNGLTISQIAARQPLALPAASAETIAAAQPRVNVAKVFNRNLDEFNLSQVITRDGTHIRRYSLPGKNHVALETQVKGSGRREIIKYENGDFTNISFTDNSRRIVSKRGNDIEMQIQTNGIDDYYRKECTFLNQRIYSGVSTEHPISYSVSRRRMKSWVDDMDKYNVEFGCKDLNGNPITLNLTDKKNPLFIKRPAYGEKDIPLGKLPGYDVRNEIYDVAHMRRGTSDLSRHCLAQFDKLKVSSPKSQLKLTDFDSELFG